MLSLNVCLLWVGFMCPLMFSPGPANLFVAMQSLRVGVRGTLPLIAGLCLVNGLIACVIGVGFLTMQALIPQILPVLSLLGALYMLYLSGVFFNAKAVKTDENGQHLSFYQAVILQLSNGKLYVSLVMMYSLFLHQSIHYQQDALLLSVMFSLLALSSYLLWSGLGRVLAKQLGNRQALWIQRYVFAGLLFFMGLKMLLTQFLLS